jgi:DNA transformation protein and related proteins
MDGLGAAIVQDCAMAAPQDPFTTHCVELLGTLGDARARRMFGGTGLYVDDLFVALIAFERLYLKVDGETRASFEAAGCEPFVYEGSTKPVTMSYYTAPDDAVESPAQMQPWARLAIAAALRARAAKPASASRKPVAAPRAPKATMRKARAATPRSKPIKGAG